MSLEKATGIVLANRDTGEADRVCSVITREKGKMDMVFRGIRKSKRRSITATEPGALLNLVYYHNSDTGRNNVKEHHVVQDNSRFRHSLVLIYALFYILEVTHRTTSSEIESAFLFDFLSAGMDTLGGTSFPLHLVLFYTLQLLLRQGLVGEIDQCHSCGRVFTTDMHVAFGTLDPACSDCIPGKSTQVISGNTLKLFRAYLGGERFNRMDHSVFSLEEVRRLVSLVTGFAEQYYSIQLKSFRLLMDVAG